MLSLLPREIILNILEFCDESAYVSLRETGLAAAYPVDCGQHERKKQSYVTKQKLARRQRMVSNIRQSLADDTGFHSSIKDVEVPKELTSEIRQGLAQVANLNDAWTGSMADIFLNHFDGVTKDETLDPLELGRNIMSRLSTEELEMFMQPSVVELARRLEPIMQPELLDQMHIPEMIEQMVDNNPNIGELLIRLAGNHGDRPADPEDIPEN